MKNSSNSTATLMHERLHLLSHYSLKEIMPRLGWNRVLHRKWQFAKLSLETITMIDFLGLNSLLLKFLFFQYFFLSDKIAASSVSGFKSQIFSLANARNILTAGILLLPRVIFSCLLICWIFFDAKHYSFDLMRLIFKEELYLCIYGVVCM